jgi:hypothetical protein
LIAIVNMHRASVRIRRGGAHDGADIVAPLETWFNGSVSKDWLEWHGHYDTPNSSLAHRLAVVHRDLRRALAEAPCGEDGVVSLISICAGEGRDVLPVLAEQDSRQRVRALLVELDPIVSQRARTAVASLGLSGVEVRIADAGTTDAYLDVQPAGVLLACGVFGNITVTDMRRTIATLPALLAVGGIVIWTRATRRTRLDPSLEVRNCFLDHGFAEMSFTHTADDTFRIGMHRLAHRPAAVRRPQPGTRMFTFV